MSQAEALQRQGKTGDALLQLRVVESTFPELTDRLALLRGEWLLAAGQPEPACEAFGEAQHSLDRNVAAYADVGGVRCLLAADRANAEGHLQDLLRRYPRLPVADELLLEFGQHLERRGKAEQALAVYRDLDIHHPSTPAGRLAREAMVGLRVLGLEVQPLTSQEAIRRLEHMARYGPFEEARTGITRLLSQPNLERAERARLHVLQAKMARIEGRWEATTAAVQAASTLNPASGAERYLPPVKPHNAYLPQPLFQQEGEARIKRLLGRRSLHRASIKQVQDVLQVAVQFGLSEQATAALERIALEVELPAPQRFDAALSSVGVAADTSVASVLSNLMKYRTQGVASRYHYARALERMGDVTAAKREYEQVIALEQGDTRYYSLWSEQRLWAIASAAQRSCVLSPMAPEPEAPPQAVPGITPQPITLVSTVAIQESRPRKPLTPPPSKRRQTLRLLGPLIDEHDHAYPWLSRAAALIQLDRFEDAADELSELYLAYRDARGQARLRSGLASVFAGAPASRDRASSTLRRERLRLTLDNRQRLARIANLLGDHGVGLRLFGYNGEVRPRAYERLVIAAAKRHDLDPDLLFAVMRVESIYNRRIISHVGAVGLTQIMPRTGHLIAQSVGDADFNVLDLLDPATNLDYSAWYLASLIRRFDGHVPLAVAAYNGGPHNVRLWLRKAPPTMPMDAFLEHIPFTQTHRYVRRVLTHYAAYREQRDLPMPRLGIHLPETKPDMMAF